MTPEIKMEVDLLRTKQADGSLTLADARRFVEIMREGRVSAAANSSKARSAKATVATSIQNDLDLL